jgi:hypothetical protein
VFSDTCRGLVHAEFATTDYDSTRFATQYLGSREALNARRPSLLLSGERKRKNGACKLLHDSGTRSC